MLIATISKSKPQKYTRSSLGVVRLRAHTATPKLNRIIMMKRAQFWNAAATAAVHCSCATVCYCWKAHFIIINKQTICSYACIHSATINLVQFDAQTMQLQFSLRSQRTKVCYCRHHTTVASLASVLPEYDMLSRMFLCSGNFLTDVIGRGIWMSCVFVCV